MKEKNNTINKWDNLKIKELAKKITAGGTPGTQNPEFWGGNILWMNSGEINLKKINFVKGRITEKGLKNSSTKVIPSHSVLIALAGQGKTRGTVAVNKVELCINQSLVAIIPNQKILSDYLYYNLDSRYEELRSYSTGNSGRGSLNLGIIKNIEVKFPRNIKEQKKTVEILSTWDQAIENLNELIDIKKKRRKALMQQFLTGKRRFKDFKTKDFQKEPIKGIGKIPRDWNVCSLSDYSEILFSNVDKKSKSGEQDVFLCNYLDVYKNDIITPELSFMKATAKDSLIRKFQIKNDDVIITKDSETPNDIAVPAYVKGQFDNVLCGYHLAIIRTKKKNLSGKFLHLLLQLKSYQHYFFTLSNGVTRFGLNVESVKKATVFMPSLKEQENISNFIFSLQKEIHFLMKKKTTFLIQKRGLMQKLLTGEIKL
ncbi:MAG: restriction endonuclease subunit S [Oligoflexia bacterium]|nr:restriction endonuclease subunit S [Oligoflexia bacterium]